METVFNLRTAQEVKRKLVVTDQISGDDVELNCSFVPTRVLLTMEQVVNPLRREFQKKQVKRSALIQEALTIQEKITKGEITKPAQVKDAQARLNELSTSNLDDETENLSAKIGQHLLDLTLLVLNHPKNGNGVWLNEDWLEDHLSFDTYAQLLNLVPDTSKDVYWNEDLQKQKEEIKKKSQGAKQ